MTEPINPADFTKADLQAFAGGEDLPTSGTKAQLAERLDEHFAPNADHGAAAFEPKDVPDNTVLVDLLHERHARSKAMEQEAKERGNGRVGGSVFDHAPGKPSVAQMIIDEVDAEGDEDE